MGTTNKAMAITIHIPDEITDRLEAAGIRADEAARLASAALAEAADRAEIRAWWDQLSLLDKQRETVQTQASLKAADSGRTARAQDVYIRVRESTKSTLPDQE